MGYRQRARLILPVQEEGFLKHFREGATPPFPCIIRYGDGPHRTDRRFRFKRPYGSRMMSQRVKNRIVFRREYNDPPPE